MGKKIGDRRDGVKLKTGGFEKFWCTLKPKRSENEVFILKELDVTKLKEYLEKKKKKDEKMTYFHVFSTAFAKVIYNKPLLNRFVINKSFYERNEVTMAFVAKTAFTDEAKELLTVLKVEENDNINTLSKKIRGDVKKIRNNEGNNTDDFIDKLRILPKWLMAIVVWVVRRLDNHDLLPKSLTKNSIYHSTVLLSNLGSIHCSGIYHNLTNFGTTSIVVTIGEVKKAERIIDGKIEERYVCDFGITLDERIADGVYFAKCINLMQYVFNNPSLLEEDVNAKIVFENSK